MTAEINLPAVHHQGDNMSTHIETEAAVRRMDGYGEAFAPAIVAFWREHHQPAVPATPDGCELVEEDGVPVFRAPTNDDYGWLDLYGAVRFTPAGNPSPEFGGRRYIVRQSVPPVPTEVERLARVLAEAYWARWSNAPGPSPASGHMETAQDLYDLGVRCPEETR